MPSPVEGRGSWPPPAPGASRLPSTRVFLTCDPSCEGVRLLGPLPGTSVGCGFVLCRERGDSREASLTSEKMLVVLSGSELTFAGLPC